jgi:hypothetical protein
LQKFYCIKCVLDFENHLHKSDEISSIKFIAEVEERWRALVGRYAELKSAAQEKVRPFVDLIAYLDDISKESETLKPT